MCIGEDGERLFVFCSGFSVHVPSLLSLQYIFFTRRLCRRLRWNIIFRLAFVFLWVLRTAHREERLVLMESGIGSPCLDCRYGFCLTPRRKTWNSSTTKIYLECTVMIPKTLGVNYRLYLLFRRVNTELALKCRDADLLILEGMGR